MSIDPDTVLAEWAEVPRGRGAALERLGLVTVRDLLLHFPRRYEDRRRFDRFPDDEMDRSVCLFGVVAKTSLKRLGGWRRMFDATFVDESAGVLNTPLTLRWFNMAYVQKLILTGQRLVVFGRPKRRGRLIVIDHPEFEVIDDSEPLFHLDRITPIHPAGEGISTRFLRRLVHDALGQVRVDELRSLVPGDGSGLGGALRDIHFPPDAEALAVARKTLAREELFAMQAVICARRAEWERTPGVPRAGGGELFQRLRDQLPFALTGGQMRVMDEIRADLASSRRMNRLLQGDVGSGKTLVAVAAMLEVVEAGWGAALMAPTQILAEQHYLNFQRLLGPMGVPVALRTGARRTDNALPLFEGDRPGVIVGTHALLFDGAGLDRLGLVVIDEQHKFGVLQRSKLIDHPDAPDVLVMTATPIPRTLCQTVYGDLDVSVLGERPANRGEVVTVVRDAGKLPDAVEFVRKQIGKGRQAYVVYPLVEESEKLVAKAVMVEFEKWRELLAPHGVGMLHGRMRSDEKEAVMGAFRGRALAALVATTVIEVGVDVPNASVMVIENAERFGLAQLHQLRGRIGRGAHKAFCILLHDADAADDAREKLAVMESTTDGFVVAEADLRLRGPGDMLGTAQTGLPPLRLADLAVDADEMIWARARAAEVFSNDPRLESAGNAAIKRLVERAMARAPATTG